MKNDVLAYLESTKPPETPENPEANKIHKRRASVAGGQLFSIENDIVESAADYFQPVPRLGAASQSSNQSDEVTVATINVESIEKNVNINISIQDTNLSKAVEDDGENTSVEIPASVRSNDFSPINNFDPFRRLSNVPFAMGGRKRRNSMFEMYVPALDTIIERSENTENP